MTSPDTPLSKRLIVEALKACCTHEKDEQNERRFIYQTGRNSVAEYLLMEIAFGSFEFPAHDNNSDGKPILLDVDAILKKAPTPYDAKEVPK